MTCWKWTLLLLATTAAAGWSAHAAPVCPLLDASGCCGGQCRVALCAALYDFGFALGAQNTSGPLTWHNRTGWQELYSLGRGASNADAACASLQAQYAAGTATPQMPFFCSWVGLACNATLFSQFSSCSTPTESSGILRIEIVNNNLSGNLSSSAFMDALQLLHDCGLRQLVLGGGYGELRGTMGPEWGRLTELHGLSLFTTNLTGQLPDEIGQLTALEFLDLGGNYITGTLPETLGNMTRLRLFNIGKNGFTDLGKALGGPLPASITQLRNLEVLSVESNELSGTVPPNLCTDMTALRAVSLRDNQFYGNITQFALCSLQSLDLSDNSFTGPLPAPLSSGPLGRPPWLRLMSISLSNNQLTGSLPEFAYGSAPLISIINVAANRLTGSFPHSWTFLPWMSQVDLSYNNFSGTLPDELAFQSMLTSLRLHSNPYISGIISPWFRLTVSLQTFTLHNTSMTGPLPGLDRATYLTPGFDATRLCGGDRAGLGRLPTLQIATLSDTDMTAQCDTSERDCDDVNAYLPWYLVADPNTWDVPRPEQDFHDNAHMKCPRIIQEQFCRLYRPPEPFPSTVRPSWSMSPSYYHYKGCTCMGGYTASYITKKHGGVDVSVLVCSPSPSTLDPAAAAGVSVAASVVGLLLLAYCGYFSWYGRWGLPRLQRAVADLQKRREGAPTTGRVSIVVTDIESYSALMVTMPLSMGQAVSQHSNVIRRAAWTHYGFVVGQEGDSFILAFRDACDAVAFCLQVQQGLAKVPWPVELLQHQQQKDLAAAAPTIQQLLGHEPSAAITATDLLATPAMEAEADAPSVSLLNGSPSSSPIQSFCGGRLASGLVEGLLPDGRAASFDAAGSAAATAAAPSSAGGESAGQTTLLDLLLQRSNSSKLWNRQQQQQQGPNGSIPVTQNARVSSTLTAQTTAAAAAAGSQGVRMQRDSSQDTAPGSPVTSADGNTAWNSRDSGSFLRPIPSGSAAAIGADEGGRPVSLSPLLLQQQQQQQWLAPASVLVPGLRVRMGVASGALGDQEDCMNSKVLETARVVSDAGGGGQVLLDSVTFGIIKDRLEELGQVGSSGYVSSSRVTGWGTPKGWLARLARRHVQLSAEAVVLDMGLYSLPGTAVRSEADGRGILPELPAAAVAALAATADVGARTADSAAQCSAEATAPPAAAAGSGKAQPHSTTQGSPADGCVRLYQVLAPKCVARALLFGNALALKRGACCHDLPYFCAPASVSRSLLDMLLLDGPSGHTPVARSFSNISSWAGSKVWLRHKYRLPLTSAAPVLGAAGGPGSVSIRHGGASPSRSPFSTLTAAPSGYTASSKYGGALMPLSPPLSRTQSASLYGKQPVLEQQQQLDRSQFSANAAVGAAVTDSAAAGHAEGTGTDSAHGSLQSAGTSNSAWPMVSIPLRGLATLWSSPCSEASAACGPSVSGITFVFASAVLPRSIKLESGSVSAQVSRMVGGVVRQTLMAFAAAAAADGSGVKGALDGSGSAGVMAGYLFRECVGEMKYLLAFHSPKAALEWCLLVQEALLWQDWPAAAVASAGTKTADPSAHSMAPAPQTPTRAVAATAAPAAGGSSKAAAAAVNGQGAPAAAAAAAAAADVDVSSSVLFGGPRLKMGVAAGAPQSVMPDHMGRADYHGNAVNMAARYEAVCAQPGQIVCDAALAESVMAEWAAAAAEAAAVQQELQRISEAGIQADAAAAQDAGDAVGRHTVTAQSLAALQQQQQQDTARRSSSSPFAAAAQQEYIARQQQQVATAVAVATAAAVAAEPNAAQTAAAGSSNTAADVDSGSRGMGSRALLWPEPSLSSSASGAVQAAALKDESSAAAAAAADQSDSSVHSPAPGAGHVAAAPAAAALHTGPSGETGFPSFVLACPAPAQAPGSITSPFAGATAATLVGTTAAGFGSLAAAAPAAAAAAAGKQAAPARMRSLPYMSPVATRGSHCSIIGSAPTSAEAGRWMARGSPPTGQTPLPAASAALAAAKAAAGTTGRSSLESRPSSAATGVRPPQRRASTPGAVLDGAASGATGVFSFSSAGGSNWGANGTAAAGGGSGGGGGVSGFQGVPGLGGGLGIYRDNSSRRLSVTARYSPTWSHDPPHHQQQQQLGPQQQQYLQQQRSQRSGRSGYMKPAGAAAAAAAVPPQLLPLQPPVALPCRPALPTGLPAFEVSVQAYRLGRYNFKGASAPVAMVEVVATHLLPRRQHLLDPAQLPKGPKGGLAEPQEGLVDAIQGVQLPGLAHVYRHMYRERTAAAAASAASVAAAAATAAQHSRGMFVMHRFLRPSLQLQHDSAAAAGAVAGGNAASLTKASLGSVASSGSLAVSSQARNPGSVAGRLGSLLTRSLSQVSGRRASVASSGSGQGSRPGSTGGAVLGPTAKGSSGVHAAVGAVSVEGEGRPGAPGSNAAGSAAAAAAGADKGQGVATV